MALSQEATQELRDAYALNSAEELRGMMGDDADHDAVIQSILDAGKAVELPGAPVEKGDADADPAKSEESEEDDDDEAGDDQGQDEDDPDAAAAAPEVPPAAEADTPAPAAPAAVDVPALDLSYLAEKYDAKLKDLDTANATSLKSLMDGDLSPEDYAAKQAQYLRDRDTLRDQKASEAQWGTEVHNFQVKAAQDSGINYFTDTEKAESLDAWVKHLAGNLKNADKSGEWFMAEAHKKVMVEYGIAAQPAPASQKQPKTVADEKKVAQKTARTPNLNNIPPTLSGLPAAAPAASGDEGEFDHLSRMSGAEFEKAIAGMSAAQRARFEAE